MSFTLSATVEMQGLDNLIKAAGPSANVGLARGLNRTGKPVQTRYLREVRKILGIRKHPLANHSAVTLLKRNTSTVQAKPWNLKFSLAGWGKGLNLIYYQPKETPEGLSVMWLGARKIVPRSFMHGGRFPKRKGGLAKLTGRAFLRTGSGKRAITSNVKGPGVAEGMVAPSSIATWEAEAQARLPANMARELLAILTGNASSSFGRAGA